MQRSLFLTCIALAALGPFAANAQVARPGDRAVSDLIENTQKAVKQFERSLDPDLRRGTIRGAKVEVNVQNYLNDFTTDLDRLRDRFKPNYSASSELDAVLRKANDVDTFVKSKPASLKGRSEWDVSAAAFNQLAAAYGTTFPTPADAAPRRIGDAEIQQATDTVTKQGQAYRKALKDAFTKEEAAALTTAQKSVDALSTAAKNLKKRVGSGKAASGDAGVIAETFAAAQAAVAGRTLPAPATEAWKGIEAAVAKIGQAFGAPEPAAATAAPAG